MLQQQRIQTGRRIATFRLRPIKTTSITPLPEPCPDDDLVAQAAKGEEHAFAELIERHRGLVVRIARRYFNRPEDVEEIVHLSFVSAWFAISGYRGGSPHSFLAWLSRIATNSCYDELRKRKRRREDIFSQLSEPETDYLFEQTVAEEDSGAEERLINHDLTGKLLGLLAPEDRRIFVLLKTENFSIAEIAQNIGWTESKVKMRIHRSRSILQRYSCRYV